MRTWFIYLAVIAALGAVTWGSDAITLQGERTVYTADCVQGSGPGQWQGRLCSGRLAAGDRFRFRALKPHREVIFWTVGSAEPSGKFTDCQIEDGRNWLCKPNADARRTITLQMAHGSPVPDASGQARAFHAVSKTRWWLIKAGLPLGNTAGG